MAPQTQQSDTSIREIDPRLRILIDANTTEADVHELLDLAHQHLDARILESPDALLAIMSRVINLSQHSEHTQAQILALMEQVANAEVGRFRKLIRLVLNGAFKKLKGGRYKVGAITFYGGVDDIGEVDKRNQYEVPEDPANKALFNEAQNGIVRLEGAPYDYTEDFYGDQATREAILEWEVQAVEQELNKRVEQAKAIEQGADVDIDALIEDVDQIMRAFSDVDEVVPSVEESLSPQGAR